ncbi:hypothetical protein SDJN03_10139, partial [Cucurbita argyrosperma subsp. sororia]
MGQSGTQSQAELIQATRAEGVSSRMRKKCHHGRGMRRGLFLGSRLLIRAHELRCWAARRVILLDPIMVKPMHQPAGVVSNTLEGS